MTREEREAIRQLPINVRLMDKWQKDAWNAIIRSTPGCMMYMDARHAALELDSEFYQNLMLELICESAKRRLAA